MDCQDRLRDQVGRNVSSVGLDVCGFNSGLRYAKPVRQWNVGRPRLNSPRRSAVIKMDWGGAIPAASTTVVGPRHFGQRWRRPSSDRETIDCHVVALDMKTGREIWKQKFADYKEGYTGIIAPLVANGVIITGMAGGDRTTRGFLDGWDPETGKKLWRLHTIPAPGEPGSETWPKDMPDAWKYGGGATWQNGSYDPELDLVYWGTGNAEPYNPAYRGGLDSLYTASVLALRPKTGELVWHYQYMPNESFDLDGSAEPVIADLSIDGRVRKVVMSANKNGFLYLIDRTNGALIAAHPYVKVNWASHIDSETGRPVLTDVYDRAARGETVEVWPSRGTNATLMAFNPKTGLVYLNSWEIARILKYVKFDFVLGQGSTGAETRFRAPPGEPWGYHMAFDPLSGKAKWKVPLMETASSAGMLATDGG